MSQRRGGELEPEVDDGNARVADTSDTSVKHSCKAPTNQAMIASPEVVSPVPKANKRSIPKQKSKNKGDTLILTSTPVKMKLSLRNVKPVRPKRKKHHQVPDKLVVSRKIKHKKILRPIESADSSSSCEETHRQLQENFEVHTSDEAESESDENAAENNNTMRKSLQNVNENNCYYCGDEFSNSKPNEQWAKCSGGKDRECRRWAHVLCLASKKKNMKETGDAFHVNFERTGLHHRWAQVR